MEQCVDIFPNNACSDVMERIATDGEEHKFFDDGKFVVRRIELTPLK